MTRRLRLPLLVASLLAASLALALDRLLQPSAFPVQSISLEGPFERVQPIQLESAVGRHARGNFFTLDLKSVANAVRAVPWVDQVSVRRAWPRSIEVSYSEHEIVARWSGDGWLNSSGRVVAAPGYSDPQARLPSLSGPDGEGPRVLSLYRNLGVVLENTGMALRAVTLDDHGQWSLQVAAAGGAFELRLGRTNLAERLQRFADVYPTVAARGQIRYADLRYPNGFAVAAQPVLSAARDEKG
ncbi:MAG: cell division protein FtsQ/DivIB [Gammaproteobacteria bacterium]|nr:cell division protein FtsQ/DivIB [Gammaproteobacteria bacterium]